MQGYEALRNSAAWLDLSARGRIRVTGEDRARLLHAISTNHIQQLVPGTGCYAFFLDAQGHILADANVLCFEDHFLLDTEPETAQKLLQHIDKYIIADDVALEDVTAAMAAIGVEGPAAVGSGQWGAKAGAVGRTAHFSETAFSHQAWNSMVVAAISATGAPGFRIFLDPGQKESLVRELGLPQADEDAIRVVRLEHGRPRYGEDISERHLPHETQLMHAVHFNKGCYLGQEIVERVRSRGQVHRLLVPLRLASQTPPAPGMEVLSNGEKAGEISSAAFSPALNEVVAIAYIRREFADKPLSVAETS